MTRTTVVGNPSFYHAFNNQSRPIYKFSLTVGPLLKSEVECLSALHAFHQGIRYFLWDGGPYGGMEDYLNVGEGDGNRRDFFLPNRHIGANSLAVRTMRPATGVTSSWVTAYSLYPGPGVLFFAAGSAPASGDIVQAKYGCTYLLNFAPEGLVTEQIARDLFVAQITLYENPDPIRQTVTEVVTRQTEHYPILAQTIFGASIGRAVTYAVGGRGRLAVSSGATTATITTSLITSHYVTLVPEWNTTWWVTSLSATQANLGFGTQVTSGGSFIQWGTI